MQYSCSEAAWYNKINQPRVNHHYPRSLPFSRVQFMTPERVSKIAELPIAAMQELVGENPPDSQAELHTARQGRLRAALRIFRQMYGH